MTIDNEFLFSLAFVSGVTLFKYLALYNLSLKHRERKKRVVGKVTRVSMFPVKSLKGFDVEVLHCTASGAESLDGHRDRCVIVCNNDYSFVTARQYPTLLLINVKCLDGKLILSSFNNSALEINLLDVKRNHQTLSLKVWGEDVEGYDCGDLASKWITNYIGIEGRKFHIVYHDTELKSRLCKNGPSSFHKASADFDKVAYQDGFPILMMTEPSLVELNDRLKKKGKMAVMDQFRPNIVVSGCAPFEEDIWNDIYVGSAVFHNIKPCDRCIMTTINPENGVKDPDMEPLRTLRSYRLLVPEFNKSPCFGINLVVRQEGAVRVGDTVFATFKK